MNCFCNGTHKTHSSFDSQWLEKKEKKWSKTSTQRRHRLHLFTLFFTMCFFYEIISFFCFFIIAVNYSTKVTYEAIFLKKKKIKSFSLKSFMSRLYCDTIETRLFCYEIYVLSHFIRFVRSFVRSSVRSYAAYN